MWEVFVLMLISSMALHRGLAEGLCMWMKAKEVVCVMCLWVGRIQIFFEWYVILLCVGGCAGKYI